MPTRQDWLPYGVLERGIVFQNIANQIDEYAAVLGLSSVQTDRIKAIAAEYEYAVGLYERNRLASKALRKWRDHIISGTAQNRPASPPPQFDNTPPPPNMRFGIVGEMRKLVAVIKASPGFTTTIGVALGIMPPNRVKIPLSELVPKVKITAQPGYHVRIACEMQKMDALAVEYRRNGEEEWQNVAILTKLPATIYVEPAILGVPESGTMRCRYYNANKYVGNFSPGRAITLFGL